MRCGDTVKHLPTGETWQVAYVDGDRMSWAGWPEGEADVADCVVERLCTDEEHLRAVASWRRSRGYRRMRVAALYPDAWAAACEGEVTSE